VDPSRWLGQAAEDLRAARTLLADEEAPARLVCFLAHPVAEKAIKAMLFAEGRSVPKVHELAELAAGLPSDLQERLERRELEALTPWAIEGRYADDLVDTNRAIAAELVRSAEAVLGVARAAIGARG
jgi:HEPN domain-containing protein